MINEADKVATMVSAIGTEHFGEAVLDMLDPRLEIGHCTAFEQDGDESPRCIMAAGRGKHGAQAASDLTPVYMESAYRADPVLRSLRSREHCGAAPTLTYFDALHKPDWREHDEEYLARYYEAPRLAQEAVYSLRHGERLLWVSLYRGQGSGRFSERDRHALGQLSRLMLSSVQKQSQLQSRAYAPATPVEGEAPPLRTDADDARAWSFTRAELQQRVSAALLMAPRGLTIREADVCSHIVMGYATLAISLNLGISINTVGTHRKRAYAKLGVSSQTELFNVCLRYGLAPHGRMA